MTPLFSIIIPTYQRPEPLRACLESLSQLNYPREKFEVIVVDDGSEVQPVKIIDSFKDSLEIKLLSQCNAGPSKARNTGAAIAKGKYLAFTDDDCLAARDWLKALDRSFNVNPHCMIGGHTKNAIKNNIYSTTSQMIIDIVYRLCNKKPDAATFLASNNLALPAKEFLQLGGFDVSYRTAEDRNLCARWLNAGHRIVYDPKVIINHASVLNFKKFCKQFFNYGRGAYHFHVDKTSQTVKESYSWLFHLSLNKWLFYPFSKMPFHKAVHSAGLLIIWEVSNILGFFWEALRAKPYVEYNSKSVQTRRPVDTIQLTEKSS